MRKPLKTALLLCLGGVALMAVGVSVGGSRVLRLSSFYLGNIPIANFGDAIADQVESADVIAPEPPASPEPPAAPVAPAAPKIENEENEATRTNETEQAGMTYRSEKDGEMEYSSQRKIRALTLDMKLGEVTVVGGDHFSIETNGMPAASSEGEGDSSPVCRVDDDQAILRWVGDRGFFNLDDVDIKITLPSYVESINVSLALGSMSMENVSLKRADLSLSMGSLTCTNVKADEFNPTVSTGDLSFNGTVAKSMIANVSVGRCDLNLKQKSARADLNCSVGNIDVNGKTYTMTSYTGTVGAESSNAPHIIANVSMGDLHLALDD